MKISLYTPIYSLTLLLSAALLFSVQPMFSKMILPLLGGTPQVWNTAMLFFQIMLLGGYAYAHLTSKFLGIRVQSILHLALLAIFTVVLPLAIPDGWVPPVDENPTFWQLSLMTITIGGPFFILSGSAPMLQHWFANTDHPDSSNPYFLYGASNLGSMTALLSYPFIIEPLWQLSEQSQGWAWGYTGLIAFTAISAFLAWNNIQKKSAVTAKETIKVKVKLEDDAPISWSKRFLWLALAFVPSSLMLGVTTFITTDVASVPLLWIMPLALYVGTFVIVFARKPLINSKQIATIQGVAIIVLLVMIISGYVPFIRNAPLVIGFHIALFFFSALACHTELAASRPGASKLTEFYLIMSIGGAMGGFFNAIIAPNYFVIPIEYAMALVAAVFLRHATNPGQSFAQARNKLSSLIKKRGLDSLFAPEFFLTFLLFISAVFAYASSSKEQHYISALVIAIGLAYTLDKRWIFAIMVSSVIFFFPPGYETNNHLFKKVIHNERNFFGVIKIAEMGGKERVLLHGTTNHGTQALAPEYKLTKLSYYTKDSPLDLAFSLLDKKDGPQKIAVLGLGIGVTACFKKEGRHFDFFEIDPNIVKIAENREYFTFLSDCGSPYDIILGDGRLKIKGAADHSYDMIVLDAFSSDNIPVHLLTLEAIEIYLQKLKNEGMLVLHISNNHLDLEPVLTEAAKALGMSSYGYFSLGKKIEGTEIESYAAHFVIILKDEQLATKLQSIGWSKTYASDRVKLWTDQYSNIVSVLGSASTFKRMKLAEEKQKEEKKKQVQKTGKTSD